MTVLIVCHSLGSINIGTHAEENVSNKGGRVISDYNELQER